MALEKDFLSMTSDTVTVFAPSSSMSKWGSLVATTSDGVSYAAVIDQRPRKVLSANGVEEVASGTVYVLSSSADIGLEHSIELPNGKRPELLRVEPLRDEDGLHHTEVSFR